MSIFEKPKPNRATRRAIASRERHQEQTEKIWKFRFAIRKMNEEMRMALSRRIAKTVARREARDAYRKEQAKLRGINWKRIILTSSIKSSGTTFDIKN